MRGGPRRSGLLLDLFACFLIPAYTLLFAGSRAWFSTNFSVIAEFSYAGYGIIVINHNVFSAHF